MTPQPRILYQSHRLTCPICQREGDCEAHLVETWQEGHRTEHLTRALGGHPEAFRLKQQLQERYAKRRGRAMGLLQGVSNTGALST